MADLVVAGAGMAGLVAAAEARRLGAEPLVLEKLARPGGSMRLSSGVIWRHRDFDRFREECPDGDERLQRLLFERLDADIDWLESLGAPVAARETGNPLTAGIRFDPAGLTDALVEAAGGLRLGRRTGRLRACARRRAASRAAAGRAAHARHGWLRGRPRAARGARVPGGGTRLPARGSGQHGRRPAASASPRAPPPAPGSTRSTPARCRRRPLGSARTTSCGSRSSTRATRGSRTSAGRRYETRRGPRSTWRSGSCASRGRARGSASRCGQLGERVRERTVAEMIDAAEAAGAPVRRDARACDRGDGGRSDDHARRPGDRRARPGGARRVRLRSRRRRNRHGRLRERAGGGAGLRPDRGPSGAGGAP